MSAITEKALEALRALPVEAQEAFAAGLLDEMAAWRGAGLTDAQREVVLERLARPLELVPPETVAAKFERFGPPG